MRTCTKSVWGNINAKWLYGFIGAVLVAHTQCVPSKVSGKDGQGHESVSGKGEERGRRVMKVSFKGEEQGMKVSGIRRRHESVSFKGEERSRSFDIRLVLGHQQGCNPPENIESSL